MPKLLPSLLIAALSVVFSLSSSAVFAEKKNKAKFNDAVRIAFVPHRSYMVDNGVASGPLAQLMECSTSYFSNIEFVEMANYGMLMHSLEANVVDIGLNMVRNASRDEVAVYGLDLYNFRILLVNDETSTQNQNAGILGVRQGTDLDALLLAKGYQVNTKAYSIERLIEMFRRDLINSFAEMEMTVFQELKAMDVDGVDYDYQVLAEDKGGAYLSKPFAQKNPSVIEKWTKVAKSCAYLAPKLDS